MSKREYIIQSSQYVFETGVLPDGQQVLVGIQLPELVAVRFSSQGALIGVDVVATDSLGSGSMVYDQANAELARWKSGVGFQAMAINVQAFFLHDRWIGIEDLPQHYQEVLDHPESIAKERIEELLNDIRRWRLRGDFVLFWDEDYYLNKVGEVVSS
ncbi:MAG: hypothetical protein WDZ51_11230 [Pirellulaceae bacterium]